MKSAIARDWNACMSPVGACTRHFMGGFKLDKAKMEATWSRLRISTDWSSPAHALNIRKGIYRRGTVIEVRQHIRSIISGCVLTDGSLLVIPWRLTGDGNGTDHALVRARLKLRISV